MRKWANLLCSFLQYALVKHGTSELVLEGAVNNLFFFLVLTIELAAGTIKQ